MRKDDLSDSAVESIKKAIEKAQCGNLLGFYSCMTVIETNGISDSEASEVYSILKEFIEEFDSDNPTMDLREYIYAMSVMIWIKRDRRDIIRLIRWLQTADMCAEYKYWFFLQISILVFNYPSYYKGLDEYVENTKLLKTIVDSVASRLPEGLLDYIPADERDDSFAIVITTQLISTNHGPTKTALDRCCSIINGLHKKVLLINSAELGSKMKGAPFYNSRVFNYNLAYLEKENLQWKGTTIPYFQCEDNQLDILTIEMLLTTIRKHKPSLIIEIGNGSIVASLADRMIPVLTDGLGPSTLEYSVTTCQTLFRSITEKERIALKEVDQSEENVLYTVFGSSLKDRTMKINRYDLDIPENAFAIATVGGRLDVDMNDEILDVMEQIYDDNTYFILIGYVKDKYRYERHERLYDHVIFCGSVDDTRAYLEICDIYLNPRRMGGGTSSIEAMDVGLPVVSYNFGDVSVNVGKDFVCETSEEMVALIYRYKIDIEFYRTQSNKAKKRADYLQETEELFCDTIKRFQKRFKDKLK